MSQDAEHIIRIEDLASLRAAREVLLDNSAEQLVAACQAGKREAQKRVYELFAGKMLHICRRYAKDQAHAQDLMHDGFIKVFLNMDQFRAQASLETWITRIMINNCLSAIRKELRRGIKMRVEDLQVAAPNNPESLASDLPNLSAQEVFAVLNELPLGYRTVFSLYVLDDFSHREIAEELGISEGTSKSQLSKAKRMLAKKLSQR